MQRRTDFTVLIVEDDTHYLRWLVAEVRDHGYRVIASVDGKEGLEKLLSVPVHIVLTNIHMPVMNGFQLLRAAKRLNANLPVVLFTGFPHFLKYYPEKIQKADAFFEKPLDVLEFLGCVDTMLGFPVDSDRET